MKTTCKISKALIITLLCTSTVLGLLACNKRITKHTGSATTSSAHASAEQLYLLQTDNGNLYELQCLQDTSINNIQGCLYDFSQKQTKDISKITYLHLKQYEENRICQYLFEINYCFHAFGMKKGTSTGNNQNSKHPPTPTTYPTPVPTPTPTPPITPTPTSPLPLPPTPQPPPIPQATLHLKVLPEGSQTPIEKASITITGPVGSAIPILMTLTSDAEGQIQVIGLEWGLYQVEVEAEYFHSRSMTINVSTVILSEDIFLQRLSLPEPLSDIFSLDPYDGMPTIVRGRERTLYKRIYNLNSSLKYLRSFVLTTTHTYNSTFNGTMLSEVNERQKFHSPSYTTREYGFDSRGNIIRVTHDRLQRIIEYDNQDRPQKQWCYEYSKTFPTKILKGVYTYEYGNDGKLLKIYTEKDKSPGTTVINWADSTISYRHIRGHEYTIRKYALLFDKSTHLGIHSFGSERSCLATDLVEFFIPLDIGTGPDLASESIETTGKICKRDSQTKYLISCEEQAGSRTTKYRTLFYKVATGNLVEFLELNLEYSSQTKDYQHYFEITNSNIVLRRDLLIYSDNSTYKKKTVYDLDLYPLTETETGPKTSSTTTWKYQN